MVAWIMKVMGNHTRDFYMIEKTFTQNKLTLLFLKIKSVFKESKAFSTSCMLKGQILEQFGENLELMGQLVQQIQVKPVCISVRGPYYEPSFMGWGWVLGKWFMESFMSLPTLGLLMYFFLFYLVPLLHRSPGKDGPKVSDEHNRAIQ